MVGLGLVLGLVNTGLGALLGANQRTRLLVDFCGRCPGGRGGSLAAVIDLEPAAQALVLAGIIVNVPG
ncbi:MAG: hypothetical protein R3F43_29680 [bacterium]